MVQVAERIISGRGLVRIDKTAQAVKEARILIVTFDVIREPSGKYFNNSYSPPRSRYGTVNVMRQEAVIQTIPLEFERQSFDFYPESAYQSNYSLICVYDGVLDSFVNLGNALGLTVTLRANDIKQFRHADLLFDELKVVCFADTAVRVSVDTIPYDLCAEEFNNVTPVSPALPEPVIEKLPIGTPLTGDNAVSPPYDGIDDDGDSVPLPIDDPDNQVPPPTGIQCQKYYYQINFRRQETGQLRTNFGYLWGEYYPTLRVKPGTINSIEMQCRGNGANALPCRPSIGWYEVANSTSYTATDLNLVSITPV